MKARTRLIVGGVAACAALIGGVAFATIPDASNVYTACRLNNVGTIRLIDPSLAKTSLLSHCTTFETQFAWNERGAQGLPGQKGATGPAGPAGLTGADGRGVTVSDVAPGPSCQYGGAAISDGSHTSYVCGGAPPIVPPACVHVRNDTIAEASLPPTQGWTAQLCANDPDVYRLNLPTVAPVEVTAVRGGGGHAAIELQLLDGNGSLIQSTTIPAGGGDAILAFTPTAAGVYYVRAITSQDTELALAVSGPGTCGERDPEPNDSFATASPMPESISGVADNVSGTTCGGSDPDWWSFHVTTAGSSITAGIGFTPLLGGPGLTGTAFIYGPGGIPAAAGTYTAPTAGTYYIRVDPSPGRERAYELGVTVTAP